MTAVLKRLDVMVLFVEDLQRSKEFYRDTLGLPVKFEDASSVGFDLDTTLLILLTLDGARDLLTNEAVGTHSPNGARSQHVSFVEDVDAVYADLVARGVVFVREPIDRGWGLRTAHFKDPDGNIWEIAQSIVETSDEG